MRGAHPTRWVCTAAGSWSVFNAISAINQVANAAPDIPNEEKALRSFLSLYNTIMSDGDASNRNGSWEEISISNGASLEDKNSIRAALFGNGTQASPLIEHVWIGGAGRTNAWQRTNSALKALGISARPTATHHNHYHIDFVAPSRRLIEPRNNLMADYQSADGAFTAVSSVTNDVTLESLAFDLAKEWGLSENDMDVYFPIDLDLTKPQVVVVAAANSQAREKAIGVCAVVDNVLSFNFGVPAQGYLIGQGRKPMDVDISNVKSNNPPAKPGAFICEPLKAARRGRLRGP